MWLASFYLMVFVLNISSVISPRVKTSEATWVDVVFLILNLGFAFLCGACFVEAVGAYIKKATK